MEAEAYLDFLTHLNCDLEAIRWENIEHVSTDLRNITFIYRSRNAGILRVQAAVDFELGETTLETSSVLPHFTDNTRKFTQNQSSVGLASLYDSYQAACRSYEESWACLRELDEYMKREHVTNSLSRQLLFKESRVTAEITVKQENATSMPKINLFGPDSEVPRLRSKMNANKNSWNASKPLHVNLEKLFGLKLRTQNVDITQSSSEQQCSICLTETDNTQFECNSCSKGFHHECIKEWCNSVPTTRRRFNTLISTCPYCQASISIQI